MKTAWLSSMPLEIPLEIRLEGAHGGTLSVRRCKSTQNAPPRVGLAARLQPQMGLLSSPVPDSFDPLRPSIARVLEKSDDGHALSGEMSQSQRILV